MVTQAIFRYFCKIQTVLLFSICNFNALISSIFAIYKLSVTENFRALANEDRMDNWLRPITHHKSMQA